MLIGDWCCEWLLCAMDIGHIPFSHAAEAEILPPGWSHERLSYGMITSSQMQGIWNDIKVNADDVAKLAVGPQKYHEYTKKSLTTWEAILSEIIVGDAFGVDRVDYLLRDSYHAGVSYGRIDHYRLIDCLRILPKEYEDSEEPTLGIDQGGLHGAEALLLSRYFMFSQVYCHHVRRIYDVHLIDYLKIFIKDRGGYPTGFEGHLNLTDNEVLSAMRIAAADPMAPGHDPARRIMQHDHFKMIYQRNPPDQGKNIEATKMVYKALCAKYDSDAIRLDEYAQKRHGKVFPVLASDGRIQSSIDLSEPLQHVPVIVIGYVFIRPDKRDDARKWLGRELNNILKAESEEEEIG